MYRDSGYAPQWRLAGGATRAILAELAYRFSCSRDSAGLKLEAVVRAVYYRLVTRSLTYVEQRRRASTTRADAVPNRSGKDHKARL